MQQKEVVSTEKEATKEKASTASKTTIDLEKSDTEQTNVKGEVDGEEEGGVNLESPFIVKKRQNQSSKGPHKKQKSDKLVSAMPLVLIEGYLDEIDNAVRDTMENI